MEIPNAAVEVEFRTLSEKSAIAAFCLQDPALYGYYLGDLDDFFFDSCTFFAAVDPKGRALEIVLRYDPPSGGSSSIQAFSLKPGKAPILERLICYIRDSGNLPRSFYFHSRHEHTEPLHKLLCAPAVNSDVTVQLMQTFGEHYKMRLDVESFKRIWSTRIAESKARSGATLLTEEDANTIKKLYDDNYPGNYFDSTTLATGMFVGLLDDPNGEKEPARTFNSAAGVHAIAPEFGVASIGNVVTRISDRGKGFGEVCVAVLVQKLMEERRIKNISLNVEADNIGAIKLYEKLGFVIHSSIEESEYRAVV
ncbi:hypothetical protein BJ742DRAFT_821611 [Cladochytrium replicatum]|nr:hypothetical protein BJ742DRAFT_821611 [Cladochytrium replicatum]